MDNSLTLHNGAANWSVSLPEEDISIGEIVTIQCSTFDDVLAEPFVNVACLHVVGQSRPKDSGTDNSQDSRNDGNDSGGIGSNGKGGTRANDGGQQPNGIEMPRIISVHEPEYEKYQFDDRSACKIIEDGSGDENNERSSYTFYVNMDNLFLRTDMKNASGDVALMEAKFKYGNVLVGLALIHESRSNTSTKSLTDDAGNGGPAIEAVVESTTRALAPFLVPMIDYLGALVTDDVAGLAHVGDDE